MSDGVDTEPYRTEWECQFCGNAHETVEEHKEHVERMHYGKLLREADDGC